MTEFVLDCSITVAWCFADEVMPVTDALLDRLRDHGAFVPSLWSLEITNVLLQAERRGRIPLSAVTNSLALLQALPITIEPADAKRTFGEILTLAHAETLTTYDAGYLDLALRRGLPLATQDQALLNACRRLGVPTLPD